MKRATIGGIWLSVGLLVVVAAIAVVVARANAGAEAQLDETLAALRNSGAPLTLDELARKPPPPEENAATYLRRAKESLNAIDKEISAAYENESDADQEAIDLGRPTAAYLKAVGSALDAYPKALELVQQAAACPAYDSQLNYSADTADFIEELTKQIQLNRAAIRSLDYHGTLQIADGRYDAAVDTGITMLRLCRHFDADPTILGSLVALACRGMTLAMIDLALRSGEVSEATRDRLDQELQQADVVAVYRRGLESDRAFGLEALEEIEAGKYQHPDEKLKFMWQAPAAFKQDQSGYLDYMARSIALADRPFAEIKGNPELQQALAAAGQLADLIAPATVAAQAALGRAQAYLRSVRILNSIQRYEHKHPGKEPTVAELGLPEAITTDPFNGKPLHVEKKPAGWLIYSVDQNLKDDGGKTTPPIDCGFGPLPRVHYE
jgi:hypothetical protein